MGRNIQEFKYLDRTLTSAMILGLAALVANSISYLLLPEERIPVGNLFLFWSAAALGPLPTLATTALSAFTEGFYRGDYLYAMRLLLLCCAIVYVVGRWPRVPIFVTTLGMWLLVFVPALKYAGSLGLAASDIAPQAILVTATQEVVLALISGTILLNQSVWGSITRQPRLVSVTDLYLHFLPLITITIIGVTVSVSQGTLSLSGIFAHPTHYRHVMILMLLSLALALLAGWWFARYISHNAPRIFSQHLLGSSAGQNFSGLSSDFWRRASVTNHPRPAAFERSASGRHIHLAGQGAAGQPLSPDHGICAIHINKTIAYCNQKFKQITGMKDNEPLGKPLDAVGVHPQLQKAMEDLIERTFQKGPKTIEVKLNQLPDRLRFVEIHSQFADTIGSSALGSAPDNIILTIRDISDRRAIEHHLLRGQRLGSLSNMVKGIAHSFNNALATIIGQASLARCSSEPEEIRTALEQIVAGARQASVLVRKLIDFADGQPAETKPGDLGALIGAHLDLLRKLVGEQIEIDFLPPQQPVGALYEPNLILQALTNLIINSKESIGSAAGQITLQLTTEQVDEAVADLIGGARAGSFAKLLVKDNGSGMNSEVLAHAFEPMFTTRSDRGNPGLGLSVVFGIVRSLDGFLSVESHVGRGTTVSLYLPQAEISAAAQTEKAPAHAGALPGTNRERILVVEDDLHVREVVSNMLRTLGYQVASCCNGVEALEQCQQAKFDLVLADMIMPKMSGADLINALRSLHQDTKTLIMTAYGVTQHGAAAHQPILPKPFDIDTLAQKIRELLNKEENTNPA